jgi:hypothetical protein
MQGPEYQDIAYLEQFMRTMQWDTVSLTPNEQEVLIIDQAMPQEWTQTLEAEQEEIFENEVLEPLYTKSLQELNAMLEITEGDIIENARESLQSFDFDIDAIMQEVETIDISLDIMLDHDDFGR